MIKAWDDDTWGRLPALADAGPKDLEAESTPLLGRTSTATATNGIGKPEPLRENLSGWWSRRIDDSNRIVYRIREGRIEIIQCGSHYRDS